MGGYTPPRSVGVAKQETGVVIVFENGIS